MTGGRRITLWANYFELNTSGPGDLILHRYSLRIRDDRNQEPKGRKARQVIRLFLEQCADFPRDRVATDFVSTLITRTKVPDYETEKDVPIRYRLEDEDDIPENPKIMHVFVVWTGELRLSELTAYLTSTELGRECQFKQAIIQALNIILGHYPKEAQHIFQVGANRHFLTDNATDASRLGAGVLPAESSTLDGGLKILRGIIMSVRAATTRVLVNVQIKHAAFYEDGPLGGVIESYQGTSPRNVARLEAFLKRLRVQLTHIKRQTRSGQEVKRIKSVFGLARPGDGRELPHPPRVPGHGAGPDKVQFWLERAAPAGSEQASGGKSKRKKAGKKEGPEPPGPAGRYISVAEYFETSEFSLSISNDANSLHSI